MVLGVLAAGGVQACSGSGVGFTSPGVASGGVAGAGHAGGSAAGSGNHAGAAASAGAGGKADPGAGSGGDDTGMGGTGADSGASPGGAPNGGAPNGGAPQAGAPNGGAPQAGAPNGGAPQAGAPNAGAPNGGAPQAGAPNGGAGAGGGGGNPSPVCGNNVLEGGEQCDDGNLTLLDGCSSSCAFEQNQRSIWFKAQFTPDAFCTANGFGSAFPAVTRLALQQDLDARVANGALSLLFAFIDLANPKAPNGSMFSLGVLYGSPANGGTYDGTSDLDWWYAPAAGTLDAQRKPVSLLAASVSGGVLTTSVGKIQLPLLSDAPLSLSKASLRLPIGVSSKPLASTGAPPGHLAAEHLSSALTGVELGGAPTSAGSGELCGNISAASLKTEQIPADFTVGGATPCYQGYSQANTFLDVLVGGCTVAPGATVALIATQPDQVDASVPNPGTGGPYKLSANAAHSVTMCRDKNDNMVTLATCLTAAAYSTAYKFATDRVIIK